MYKPFNHIVMESINCTRKQSTQLNSCTAYDITIQNGNQFNYPSGKLAILCCYFSHAHLLSPINGVNVDSTTATYILMVWDKTRKYYLCITPLT